MNFVLLLFAFGSGRADVSIHDDRLFFGRTAEPARLSAEIQYFRLRGGYGPNVPRAEVRAQWALVLEQARAAGVEAITTYIPWDFHEYRAGRFDFHGTVDEDGDGRPDYPARDLEGFLRLVKQKGFRAVLVRPGPYISSEWGFLAIGAVPRWIYEACPECRTRNAAGLQNRFMDVMHPRFLRATENWFRHLHREVLRRWIGPQGLVRFVQLDNETNYMWQDLDHADHGPENLRRFADFLRVRRLSAGGPPDPTTSDRRRAGLWYDFMADQLRVYLLRLRRMWENLGVREPTVLFTVGESFDGPRAIPDKSVGGILPHFRDKNEAGLMTLNIYPLGGERPFEQAVEHPFKLDHNAKAVESAKNWHLRHASDYLISTEIEGCNMWPNPPHPVETMKQIYLSAIGRGIKLLNLFYFHHGYNFETDWFRSRLGERFRLLRASSPEWRALKDEDLPDAFWDQLQADVDRHVAVGFWALRETWLRTLPLFTETSYAHNLCFTPDFKPKPYFHDVVQKFGHDVIQANGDFLGRARDMPDPVCVLHDSGSHRPRENDLDANTANAEWEPALFGFISEAGFNPRVIHVDMPGYDAFEDCKIIMFQDLATPNVRFRRALEAFVRAGGTAVAFVLDDVAHGLGFKFSGRDVGEADVLGQAHLPRARTYTVEDPRCVTGLESLAGPLGFTCTLGTGRFLQVSPPIYLQFTSGFFSHLKNMPALLEFWDQEVNAAALKPRVRLEPRVENVIAWGRRDARAEDYWITVRSGRLDDSQFKIMVPELWPNKYYVVRDVWSGETREIAGSELAAQGFAVDLEKFATKAYRITVRP